MDPFWHFGLWRIKITNFHFSQRKGLGIVDRNARPCWPLRLILPSAVLFTTTAAHNVLVLVLNRDYGTLFADARIVILLIRVHSPVGKHSASRLPVATARPYGGARRVGEARSGGKVYVEVQVVAAC